MPFMAWRLLEKRFTGSFSPLAQLSYGRILTYVFLPILKFSK